MTTPRTKREFTEEFKQQMVNLANSGKSRAEIAREYDLTPSALNIGLNELIQQALLRKQTIVLQSKMS